MVLGLNDRRYADRRIDLPMMRQREQAVLRQQQALTSRISSDGATSSSHVHEPGCASRWSPPMAARASRGLTNIEQPPCRSVATELTEPLDQYAAEFRRFLDWTLHSGGELGFNRIFTETWDFREDHIGIPSSASCSRDGCDITSPG